MVLLFDNVLLECALLVSVSITLCVVYVRYCYSYWKRLKIPYIEPVFPLGNSRTFLPKGISVGIISKYFYDVFKAMGCKVGGVYLGIQPNVVIVDPDLIKDILTRDFQHFVDRGVYQNESDPISVNIFSQPGNQWKKARAKFTSTFSTLKMKSMFQIIIECSKALDEEIRKYSHDKTEVDIIETLGCFTTDVIGSCAFGISCNSFKHPDAEFRKMGRKVFGEFTIWDQINLFLSIYTPKLAQTLGVRNIQRDVSKFFFKSVKETVEYREKNNVRRNDFLQLLIDMKNSDIKLSMNEVTAQAFLFFLAGFGTSSTTATMALYELGKNQEVQDRVREEVTEVLGKYRGEITYENIGEMGYLGQVVDETLRLWPPVATLTRVCTKDYHLPNTDINIEKGIPVLIPVLGLHLDSEHWPDPLVWNPKRFSEDNRENRKPFTYLPFGEGPRNCIGMRFGMMQTKIALITILRKYRVFVSPKTVTPLGLDPDTFLMHTVNKVYLNFETIT